MTCEACISYLGAPNGTNADLNVCGKNRRSKPLTQRTLSLTHLRAMSPSLYDAPKPIRHTGEGIQRPSNLEDTLYDKALFSERIRPGHFALGTPGLAV